MKIIFYQSEVGASARASRSGPIVIYLTYALYIGLQSLLLARAEETLEGRAERPYTMIKPKRKLMAIAATQPAQRLVLAKPGGSWEEEPTTVPIKFKPYYDVMKSLIKLKE
ncbi:hypothetical protein MSG28_001301 [Choristoneura fumiferana]|uniref:Uncharacterized protein n=1 Tax=Choristoneura fumiferana TaxID=7141 RepID=A0ACC0K4U3_CHOFU|nr:hypothetical protein MSG28_001301 [Choristoneura fumiferana]